jgi:hypothetical protein
MVESAETPNEKWVGYFLNEKLILLKKYVII